MPEDRSTPTAPRRFAPAAVVALVATLLAVVAVPVAVAKTIEFTEKPKAATAGAIDLGLPAPELGPDGPLEFRLDRQDRRALSAHRKAERLRTEADRRIAASVTANQRIAAIDDALQQAEDDEARLQAIVEQRMVARYKGGDLGDLDFLFDSGGLSDLIARNRVLHDQSKRDLRTFEDYRVTKTKVEVYRSVLEELRDLNGDQAQRLQERAGRLDDLLVASQVGHDEASDDAVGRKRPKGVGGTWYVMGGAFQAQLFLPAAGSGYDGGARTPARKATPEKIAQILADKRVELDASGYQDILTGQIDGRLIDALLLAAGQFGHVRITSLKSDHGTYTSSGNVSEHAYGCAADIGTIGSTYITPSAQVPGGEVQQAVLFFMGLPGDLAPHQVISLFDLGGASLRLSDHGDHIHLGYAC